MGVYDKETQDQKNKLASQQAKANRKADRESERSLIKDYSNTNKQNEFLLPRAELSQMNRFRHLTSPQSNDVEGFRKTTDELLAAPQGAELQHRGYVTDFSDWVYSLYQKKVSPSKLARHAAMEVDIEIYKRRCKKIDEFEKQKLHDYRSSLAESFAGWKLKYKHFGEENSRALKISNLQSSRLDFYGKPDLVFKNKKGEVLIVEIKMTQAHVPKDGWPNVSAQLWAYAHADVFKDATKIILAAEIYNVRYPRIPGEVGLSKTNVVYDYGDKNFQETHQRLFDRYSKLIS